MSKTPIPVTLELNGRRVFAWVPPNKSLLHALREDFGATDVKYGCGEGVSGTCTVLLDGEPVNACLMFAAQAGDRTVVTLSGLRKEDGDLHPLQRSFLEHGGSQCGFCTPGMVLTALHYAEGGGSTDREAIRDALSGNLCRCTGYSKIVDAVEGYVAAQAGNGQAKARG
ncbi:MAG: (2Fe-2S)-binding protein [Egibacteraceae bacterium]